MYEPLINPIKKLDFVTNVVAQCGQVDIDPAGVYHILAELREELIQIQDDLNDRFTQLAVMNGDTDADNHNRT